MCAALDCMFPCMCIRLLHCKGVGSAAWQGLTANVDANAQLALQGMMQYAQEMRAKPPREE